MNGIVEWLLSICAVVIVGVVADIFLDGTKTGKFVRCALASVTLLVIVTPLATFFEKKEISFDFDEQYVSIDENYLKFVQTQKENLIGATLEKQLKEEGVVGADIIVTLENANEEEIIKLVEINLSKCVIDEKYEHINSNELVIKLIQNYINVPSERIVVYG